MKDARRNESEAMYKGPYWVFVSVLTGMPLKVEKCTFKPTIHPAGSHGDWIEMWADSHPDTAESDEGPYRYSHPKLKAAFDEGYAHARKSQAAEMARIKEIELQEVQELLHVGLKIVQAQMNLLAAYRTGGRPKESALKVLDGRDSFISNATQILGFK